MTYSLDIVSSVYLEFAPGYLLFILSVPGLDDGNEDKIFSNEQFKI